MTKQKTDVVEEKSLAVKPNGAIAESNPSMLLKLAVEKDLDVVKLGKLMELQERWEDRHAKKAFFDALTKFQRTIPELKKSKTVRFKTNSGPVEYSFAPLSSVAEQIKEPLAECGLSYRWELASDEKSLTVKCIITHREGHSEASAMSSPLDSSGSKNLVQQRGSTITYLQRYTLIPALGLATADSDVDGRGTVDDNGFQQQSGTKPRKDPKETGKEKETPAASKFKAGGKEVTRKEYIDTICKYAKDKGIKIEDVLVLLKIDIDFPDMTDAQVLKIWQGIKKAEKGLMK